MKKSKMKQEAENLPRKTKRKEMVDKRTKFRLSGSSNQKSLKRRRDKFGADATKEI